MDNNIIQINNRLTLTDVLFILFLYLKLTGQIDWSWWWITAPIWGVLAVKSIILALDNYFHPWKYKRR